MTNNKRNLVKEFTKRSHKFNVEFMENVNNDRVAGAEIFPPLANKQN